MTDEEKVKKVGELLGWTPPVVYSVVDDCHRVATQQDIDEMLYCIQIHENFRRAILDACEEINLAIRERRNKVKKDV